MITVIVNVNGAPAHRNEARRLEKALNCVENEQGATISLVLAPSPIPAWIIPQASRKCAINGRDAWIIARASDEVAIVASLEARVAPILRWLENRRAKGIA